MWSALPSSFFLSTLPLSHSLPSINSFSIPTPLQILHRLRQAFSYVEVSKKSHPELLLRPNPVPCARWSKLLCLLLSTDSHPGLSFLVTLKHSFSNWGIMTPKPGKPCFCSFKWRGKGKAATQFPRIMPWAGKKNIKILIATHFHFHDQMPDFNVSWYLESPAWRALLPTLPVSWQFHLEGKGSPLLPWQWCDPADCVAALPPPMQGLTALRLLKSLRTPVLKYVKMLGMGFYSYVRQNPIPFHSGFFISLKIC